MMCFKDRSFCSASEDCEVKSCNRNFNTHQQKLAEQWWKGMKREPPVSFQPYFECLDFVMTEEK